MTQSGLSLEGAQLESDRLNRWLALIANISVVAGIVFLVIEIQQNTASLDESRRLAQGNAYQARAFHFSSMNIANAHSPEMIDAIVAFRAAGGLENPLGVLAEMSPQDQQRIRYYYLARVTMYDNSFYQYRNGYLDEEHYQTIVAPIIKSEADLWEALFSLHTPTMQAEMDRIRAE